MIFCSQAVGVLSSAYTSGWLIGLVGARPVLGLLAFFPLLMCGTAFLIKERRRSPQSADLEVAAALPAVAHGGDESEGLLGEPWRKDGDDAQEGELACGTVNTSSSQTGFPILVYEQEVFFMSVNIWKVGLSSKMGNASTNSHTAYACGLDGS